MVTYSYIIISSHGPRLWPTSQGESINPLVMRRASVERRQIEIKLMMNHVQAI